MEEVEVWKSLDFLGYSNYEVSNFGRVKSIERIVIYNDGRKYNYPEKFLKPTNNDRDYLWVLLSQNGKRKLFKVHRLVALAFIPNDNPTEKTEINHLDENKENNHVDNLCWCSHIENINYGTRNERISKVNKGKPHYKQRKPILQYTLDGVFIREWDSVTSINIELSINQGNITACCKEKRKTAGGFIWKYKI